MLNKLRSLFNVRHIPHPQRGNYLGADKRCQSFTKHEKTGICPMPVDKLDEVGVWHDWATNSAGDVPHADLEYAWRMLKINPFDESNYNFDVPVEWLGKEYKIDPRIYQYGSALVMGTLGLFTFPIRLVKKAME